MIPKRRKGVLKYGIWMWRMRLRRWIPDFPYLYSVVIYVHAYVLERRFQEITNFRKRYLAWAFRFEAESQYPDFFLKELCAWSSFKKKANFFSNLW